MTNNASEFDRFLKNENIVVDFTDGENDDTTYCSITQKLDCGPNIKLLVVFDKQDELVSIYTFDYITVPEKCKKDIVYKCLNDMNEKYTYFKFNVDKENTISISYFLPFKNNFNPSVVTEILIGIIQVMESEYANFMKTIWS